MFLFESNRVTSALVRRPGCAVRCVSAEWHGANCEQSKWCILLRPLYFLSPSLSPPQLMTFVRRVLALCYVHTWVWYALQVLLTCIHTYIHTHTHTRARARTYVDLNLGRFSWFAQNAQHLCILYSVAYFISENIDGFRWNLILVVAVTFVFLNRRQNVVAFFVRAEETAIYASLKWMEVGFEAIRINAFSKRIK